MAEETEPMEIASQTAESREVEKLSEALEQTEDLERAQEAKQLQREQGGPFGRAVAAVAKYRDTQEIRRLLFTGIITSLLLLAALAIRDFVEHTFDDYFPEKGVKNRLLVLAIVVGISLFLVILIYEAELDR